MFKVTVDKGAQCVQRASIAGFFRAIGLAIQFRMARFPSWRDKEGPKTVTITNPSEIKAGRFLIANGCTLTASKVAGGEECYRVLRATAYISPSGVATITLLLTQAQHCAPFSWGGSAPFIPHHYHAEAKVGQHPLVGVPLYKM